MEPKLIEMAHKLEDNGLIENKDYIWLKSRISNLSKQFNKQKLWAYASTYFQSI